MSHGQRVLRLSHEIASFISKYFPGQTKIGCLDVGCGDMLIAENISKFLPETDWVCIDIYNLTPEQIKDPRWKKYKRFHGSQIPFQDKSFDVVLLCDVLHHAERNKSLLLKESKRVGKIVIVKDHFEYSIYSRFLLRMMDFFGNWPYGVNIPHKYFSKTEFENICINEGLSITELKIGINLYGHLGLLRWLLKPEWQFIAVLTDTFCTTST